MRRIAVTSLSWLSQSGAKVKTVNAPLTALVMLFFIWVPTECGVNV